MIIKLESKNEVKEIDIRNLTYYYFDNIIRFWDIDTKFRDILLYEEAYETYKNILIYGISYKTLAGAKLFSVYYVR